MLQDVVIRSQVGKFAVCVTVEDPCLLNIYRNGGVHMTHDNHILPSQNCLLIDISSYHSALCVVMRWLTVGVTVQLALIPSPSQPHQAFRSPEYLPNDKLWGCCWCWRFYSPCVLPVSQWALSKSDIIEGEWLSDCDCCRVTNGHCQRVMLLRVSEWVSEWLWLL